jgi:hypothetical protein
LFIENSVSGHSEFLFKSITNKRQLIVIRDNCINVILDYKLTNRNKNSALYLLGEFRTWAGVIVSDFRLAGSTCAGAFSLDGKFTSYQNKNSALYPLGEFRTWAGVIVSDFRFALISDWQGLRWGVQSRRKIHKLTNWHKHFRIALTLSWRDPQNKAIVEYVFQI